MRLDHPTRTLTLLCWVLDVSSSAFPVEIEDSRTVGHLKDSVVRNKRAALINVDPDELTLWKVSIAINNSLENEVKKRQFLDEDVLSEALLSKIFPHPEPIEETLRIIVRAPPIASSSPQSANAPSHVFSQGPLDDPDLYIGNIGLPHISPELGPFPLNVASQPNPEANKGEANPNASPLHVMVYPSSQHSTCDGSPFISKPKRTQVRRACTNCASACKRCDPGRPCERCIKYGKQATCEDVQRKEPRKGFKRGPYKQKNKIMENDGMCSPAQTSEGPQSVMPTSAALHVTPQFTYGHHPNPYFYYPPLPQFMPTIPEWQPSKGATADANGQPLPTSLYYVDAGGYPLYPYCLPPPPGALLPPPQPLYKEANDAGGAEKTQPQGSQAGERCQIGNDEKSSFFTDERQMKWG